HGEPRQGRPGGRMYRGAAGGEPVGGDGRSVLLDGQPQDALQPRPAGGRDADAGGRGEQPDGAVGRGGVRHVRRRVGVRADGRADVRAAASGGAVRTRRDGGVAVRPEGGDAGGGRREGEGRRQGEGGAAGVVRGGDGVQQVGQVFQPAVCAPTWAAASRQGRKPLADATPR